MYFLLYGPDTYRSRRKLNEIKEKFGQKNMAEINLNIIDGTKTNLEEIDKTCQPLPFLAEKRMVIIENLLSGHKSKDLKDKVANYLKKIPDYTIVVFYESEEIDEKLELFKKLIKEKNSQKFNLLSGIQLERWIKNETEKWGGKIEPAAIKWLTLAIGNNLWRMENEIKKLVLYKNKNVITVGDAKKLITPEIEINIFNLIDALGQKNLQKALTETKNMRKKGENEIYIFSMIVYQIRNLILIKNLLTKKPNLSPLVISKKTSLHPFVIKKTILQAKNFTLEKLKNIYQKLADFDIAIKTGKMEPETALNLLIIEITK